METSSYLEPEAEKSQSTGRGKYLVVGVLLLVVGLVLGVAAVGVARFGPSFDAMRMAARGGVSMNNTLLAATLNIGSNVSLIVGSGMVLLSAFFDLLYRYRASGEEWNV